MAARHPLAPGPLYRVHLARLSALIATGREECDEAHRIGRELGALWQSLSPAERQELGPLTYDVASERARAAADAMATRHAPAPYDVWDAADPRDPRSYPPPATLEHPRPDPRPTMFRRLYSLTIGRLLGWAADKFVRFVRGY